MGWLHLVATFVFFSVFAIVVYGGANLSWWLGIVLFAAFFVYAILQILTNGFLLFFGFVYAKLFVSRLRRGVKPSSINEMHEQGLNTAKSFGPVLLATIYIVALAATLGMFIYRTS